MSMYDDSDGRSWAAPWRRQFVSLPALRRISCINYNVCLYIIGQTKNRQLICPFCGEFLSSVASVNSKVGNKAHESRWQSSRWQSSQRNSPMVTGYRVKLPKSRKFRFVWLQISPESARHSFANSQRKTTAASASETAIWLPFFPRVG